MLAQRGNKLRAAIRLSSSSVILRDAVGFVHAITGAFFRKRDMLAMPMSRDVQPRRDPDAYRVLRYDREIGQPQRCGPGAQPSGNAVQPTSFSARFAPSA